MINTTLIEVEIVSGYQSITHGQGFPGGNSHIEHGFMITALYQKYVPLFSLISSFSPLAWTMLSTMLLPFSREYGNDDHATRWENKLACQTGHVTRETLCTKSEIAPRDGGILREKKILDNRFLRN